MASKLRSLPFETAIIESYRPGFSVGQALIETYLSGVNVRRVEGITQALWGTLGMVRGYEGYDREV